MRSALDRFKLWYEKLPSDEAAEAAARRYRQRKRAKEKEDHQKFIRQFTLPIMKAVVAQLRRVKR